MDKRELIFEDAIGETKVQSLKGLLNKILMEKPVK